MTRLFLAVVMVNVLGGAALWFQPSTEPVVAIDVTASDEVRAAERAWETAELRLMEACGDDVHGVTGVEEAAEVSNGYRVRVTATASCA